MREQKEAKTHDFRENIRVISQIQATRGRDAEHFIKIFRHEGDNVASSTLGTLLGVFEIDDVSEDSKYIVNFLFSVAKNEYFCNPKRGAMESFEATLHKINVALAEIVKHGNVRWLGKFHGTIAILEKNSIHLSASGDGRIYLYRGDSLSHISEGLASPEAMERPVKTFIEISSGQLIPGDRILFLLPEAVDIISEPILERHAGQMNHERLSQFLRTAMINKLDRGGAIVVDIKEAPPETVSVTKTKKKTTEKNLSPQNYFSETAFEKKQSESIATALSEEHSKTNMPLVDPGYTDTKTGHIYIQGDHKEVSSEPSRIAQYAESFLYFSQKTSEEGWEGLSRLFQSALLKTKFFWLSATNRTQGTFTLLTKSSSRYLSRKTDPERQPSIKKPLADIPLQKASLQSTKPTESLLRTESGQTSSAFQQATSRLSHLLKTLRSQIRPLLHWFRVFSPIALTKIRDTISVILSRLRSLFFRLPVKGRIILILASFTVLGMLLWNSLSPEVPPVSSEETPPISNLSPLPSDSIRNQEVLTADLPVPQVLLQRPDTIASAYVDGNPVIVTRTTVEIPSEQLSLPLPDGVGTPKIITPMQDLHFLFLLTDTGSFMAMSPISKTFASNTLPKDVASVSHIGTYLTYLYTLSTDGTTLTRFARVQGGFGEGTPWLKQDLPPDKNASFALNESIFIFSQSTLTQYSRGKATLVFDEPKNVPKQLILATEPENPLLVGLDSENARLIAWDMNGHIKRQYFSDTLKNAISVSLHNQTIIVSTPTETFESTLLP